MSSNFIFGGSPLAALLFHQVRQGHRRQGLAQVAGGEAPDVPGHAVGRLFARRGIFDAVDQEALETLARGLGNLFAV